MDKKPGSSGYFDSINFVFFLFRWWKPVVTVALISGTLSGIFSGPSFIRPKYRSTVIFFPTTTNSISRALLSDNPADRQDILEFGEEQQAEQLLQILNSDEVRDRIISKYNLMQHYGIDPASQYPLTRLNKEFESNISFERTEFMSVKITVYDTDAQTAANIANDIASFLDSVKSKIQHERAVDGLRIVEREYQERLAHVARMEDSLKKIRNQGIYDYTVQSEILNQEYTKAVASFSSESAKLSVYEQSGNVADSAITNTKARIKAAEAGMKNLQEKLDLLADLGGSSVSLTEQLEMDRKSLSALQEKYEKVKVDAGQMMSHKFIVNHAVKAEKKSYPIRWLIVTLSVLGSVLFCILVILGLEHYVNFKSSSSPP